VRAGVPDPALRQSPQGAPARSIWFPPFREERSFERRARGLHPRAVGYARRLAVVVLGLAMLPWVAAVAHAKAELEEIGWFQLTATGPIVGDWRFFMEAQPRIGADPESGPKLRALIIRPALGYQITEAWSLWLGYAYQPNFNPFRYENRAFQQSLHTTHVGPFKMVNRSRLEERMIEDAGQPAMRIRHQLWLAYPLPRWPAWSLVAAVEPFINLNTVSNGPIAGFDQNRLYLGVSRQIGKHLRVEIDYLNVFVLGHDGDPDVVRNGGFLLLAYNW